MSPILKNFNELFKKLNPSFKLDFICASLGSQVLEFLTPGGVYKKILSLKSKLQNIKKLQTSLKAISDLYDQFPHSKTLKNASQKIGACAL